MGYGFYVPHFARQTGFSTEDLALFWEAFQQAWEIDRSAARGTLALQGLYVFSHQSARGNAHTHHLFKRLTAQIVAGIQAPRRITDYAVEMNDADLPEGITLSRIVG